MAKQFYLPGTDRKKVTWLNNFANKKKTHQATFDFTDEQVKATEQDAEMWAYIVSVLLQNRDDMKEFTSYKNALRNGPKSVSTEVLPEFTVIAPPTFKVDADIFGRVSSDAATIKAHPKYTDALGKDFGIVGAESTFDPATFRATINAKIEPGQVRIEWVKSETDGYNIYGRPEDHTEWTLLGFDMRSPYFDKRPLIEPGTPEVREYRGRAVINDEEIGLFSKVESVTFGG